MKVFFSYLNRHFIGPLTVSAPPPEPPQDPCIPSPCGPNSQCRDIGGSPACVCLQDYIGSPPNCRPECTINSECPSNKACINQKCKDPCVGSCGNYAQCNVINHTPVCTCDIGYTGDPFTGCRQIPRKYTFSSIPLFISLIELAFCEYYLIVLEQWKT